MYLVIQNIIIYMDHHFNIWGTNMISTKRATKIICEKDKNRRNELIDKLSEEDSKYLLKQYLNIIHGDPEFEFKIELK